MIEVLGEYGIHARSAVGVAALPLNAPVEVEVIAEDPPVRMPPELLEREGGRVRR